MLILEESTNGALSWLQWIAQRSKNKKTPSTIRTTTSGSNDPFLDMLNPSQLKYPRPPISQISTEQEEETSSLSSVSPTTTTTSMSEISTTESDLGIWSWWSPGKIHQM